MLIQNYASFAGLSIGILKRFHHKLCIDYGIEWNGSKSRDTCSFFKSRKIREDKIAVRLIFEIGKVDGVK